MVVEIDHDFADYARSLIPKHLHPQRPRHPPHVTVVRKESVDTESKAWVDCHGLKVGVFYDPFIQMDDTYAWYNVYSHVLKAIRIDLGLPPTTEYTRPPHGSAPFHITVANFKNQK